MQPLPAYDHDNVFARILRNELPRHAFYETDQVLGLMDVMPRETGHALLIPKAPVRNILDINAQEFRVLMEVVRLTARASVEAFQADGISIIQSNESAGGQVVFHMHVHVIPRWDYIDLKPHSSQMEKPDILEAHAAKLRDAMDKISASIA